MSNLLKKNSKVRVEYANNYSRLSPCRINYENRSPFRESKNYYAGGIRVGNKSPVSGYQHNDYGDYLSRSPVRSRTPTRNNKSPFLERTPNREKSPIRMRTPVKLQRRDSQQIQIKYMSGNKNGFSNNPQSVTSTYNTGNPLINAYSQQKKLPKERLFNKMIAKMNSDQKEKENVHIRVEQCSKWSMLNNDNSLMRKESEAERRAGVDQSSFSALINGIHEVESVNYVRQQPDKQLDEKGMSVKTAMKATETHQRNVVLINGGMSPMAKVRKNLNSHRDQEARPKFTRRISECPQETHEDDFRYYSLHPAGQVASQTSSPNQTNVPSPNAIRANHGQNHRQYPQNVSLFEEIVHSIDGRREEKVIPHEHSRRLKENQEMIGNKTTFMKKQSAVYIELEQSEIDDSIAILLEKISGKGVPAAKMHMEESVSVRMSYGNHQFEESLNMSPFL